MGNVVKRAVEQHLPVPGISGIVYKYYDEIPYVIDFTYEHVWQHLPRKIQEDIAKVLVPEDYDDYASIYTCFETKPDEKYYRDNNYDGYGMTVSGYTFDVLAKKVDWKSPLAEEDFMRRLLNEDHRGPAVSNGISKDFWRFKKDKDMYRFNKYGLVFRSFTGYNCSFGEITTEVFVMSLGQNLDFCGLKIAGLNNLEKLVADDAFSRVGFLKSRIEEISLTKWNIVTHIIAALSIIYPERTRYYKKSEKYDGEDSD